MLSEVGMVILANLSPFIEQIGAIPLGLALGMAPMETFLISLFVNVMLFFPVYFILKFFYDKVFSKIGIFRRYLERARKKGEPYINKYGTIGLAAFICLPTPLTGTYTASMVSWLLDLDWKKSVLAIFIGSFVGGLIILASSLGILTAIGFFVK